MFRDQNAGRSHNIKTEKKNAFEKLKEFNIWEQIEILFWKTLSEDLINGLQPLFGAESFVFYFAAQKYKDEGLQKFAFCFVWLKLSRLHLGRIVS
jgi:hypothetical protein